MLTIGLGACAALPVARDLGSFLGNHAASVASNVMDDLKEAGNLVSDFGDHLRSKSNPVRFGFYSLEHKLQYVLSIRSHVYYNVDKCSEVCVEGRIRQWVAQWIEINTADRVLK